ncbi:MAG: pentapeptide repeat-containing protein [Candidatus Limnocylindrales bacterium]
MAAASPARSEGDPAHIAKVREMLALQTKCLRHPEMWANGEPGREVPAVQAVLDGRGGAGELEARAAAGIAQRVVGDAWESYRSSLKGRLDLSGADFTGQFFLSLDFRRARLVGTSFRRCRLFVCFFDGADLQGACFEKAYGIGLCLGEANLSGSCFRKADLMAPLADDRTRFDDADFSGCTLRKWNDGSGGDTIAKFKGLLSAAQQKQLARGWFG